MARANAITRPPAAQQCGIWLCSSGGRGDSDAQGQAERGSIDLSGNGNQNFSCNFRTVGLGRTCLGPCEAKFAVGPLNVKPSGYFDLLARASVKGKLTQRFSGLKVNGGSQPIRRMAQKAALQGRWEFAKPENVDGEVFGRGSTAASDWTARQNELLCDPCDFSVSPRLFIACKFGHVGQMFAKTGIPGLELRQQFVADAIAGEGEMAIR